MKCFFALGLIALLAACGTTDSELRQSGYSASYIQGFHDGRHSGMQEAGNDYEDYIKDQLRFDNDADYQRGWLAGEAEGQQLQSKRTPWAKGLQRVYLSLRPLLLMQIKRQKKCSMGLIHRR